VTADEPRDYDGVAELYTSLFLDDLDRVTVDRDRLGDFAELVEDDAGPVADLGCGPGHITNHLERLGLNTVGYDISSAMVDAARGAFPDSDFRVGDLTSLDIGSSSLAGIVARYSIIHLQPSETEAAFSEWQRVLRDGAPLLVSFFAAGSAELHGTSFDHQVTTAYELFPATIADELRAAGFDRLDVSTRSPLAGERSIEHATIIARCAGG